LRIVCCIILLSLVGCGTMQKNALKGQPLQQCMMTCMQHFDFCKNNCVDNCPNCSATSSYRSAVNFTKYVNERKVEGKNVTRELNSYRDPLQCRKVTCSCITDLATCKQSCTGVIHKRLQAVPYCV